MYHFCTPERLVSRPWFLLSDSVVVVWHNPKTTAGEGPAPVLRGKGSRRRFALLRFGSAALILLALLCIGETSVRGSQDCLAELYQRFVSGANSHGLVAFDRTIVVPRRHGPSKPLFVTFCWRDVCYLIALSRVAPITNVNNFASADKLYGFDGEAYWSFRLDSPVRVYRKAGQDRELLPPENSFNTLHVISKAEAVQQRGRTKPDTVLVTMTALASECRQLVQFGVSHPLSQTPRVSGSELFITGSDGGGSVVAELGGDPGRPSGLSYSLPGGKALRVMIDYATDTVRVTRLSDTHLVAQMEYHLVFLEQAGEAPAPSVFSWQTYRADAGQLLAHVVRNGATFSAQIATNNTLRPVRKLVAASTDPRATHRLVSLLFVLAALGSGVLLFWAVRTRAANVHGSNHGSSNEEA